MTKKEKKNLLQDIMISAKQYKKHLAGNIFMIIFDNNYIEVAFDNSRFAHLTGVEKTISAKRFYDNALKGTLRIEQFWCSPKHPHDLARRKLKVLSNLGEIFSHDGFVLEDIATGRVVYKFGFTDLALTLCFGEDFDKQGNIKGPYFVIYSLRDGDTFSKTKQVHAIDYIFRKRNDEKLYSELLLNNETAVLTDEIKLKISNTTISSICRVEKDAIINKELEDDVETA